MKRIRKLVFGMIFALLTLIVCVYAYALFNRLPLDEQRKNITIYDVNGDIIYESNFKKNMQWTSIDDIPEFVPVSYTHLDVYKRQMHS